MSGRLVNVRPKPGFVFDGQSVVPAARPMLYDGALANFLTGRGTSVDRTTHNFWLGQSMQPQQIEAAYRSSWLVRKIVDVPAEDMTRAGRDWEATKEEIAKIEAEEKRLGFWRAIQTALIFGRLGGGALFINLADMTPDRPLPRTIRPGAVVSLVPLYRTQLTLGQMDDDLLSPSYGEPTVFRVNTQAQPIIHPSRLIIFKGERTLGLHAASFEERFWGDSIVQIVDEAVKDATTATGGFAALIDEAKVDVMTMPGMYQMLAQPGGKEKFMEALQAAAMGKSIHRMLALGEGETWETRQINWAGMPDVIKTFLSIVAGAADIPATRLLGKSPDGMNSTGEADLANYFQSISAKQESDLRPALEKLDALLLPSAGVKADLVWKFSPARVLDEAKLADIEAKEATTVATLANTGLIQETALAKAVQNRLIESQRWPGLEDALKEAEAAGEGLPGDDDDLDIIPVETAKGGGQSLSAGSGGQSGSSSPARRANDAQPRTLYVHRKVVNVEDLKAWAKSQGLPELQDDLHVTIAHIDKQFDWMKVDGEDWDQEKNGQIEIAPGGVRIVEPLGDRSAVLLFTSSRLSWRHEQIVRAGAEHDFPDYQPHISLTDEPVDLTGVEPYRGRIVLGPEIFETVREA